MNLGSRGQSILQKTEHLYNLEAEMCQFGALLQEKRQNNCKIIIFSVSVTFNPQFMDDGLMLSGCPSHSCKHNFSRTSWGNICKFGKKGHMRSRSHPLRGWASMDWICCSTSDKHLIRLGFWNYGGRVKLCVTFSGRPGQFSSVFW